MTAALDAPTRLRRVTTIATPLLPGLLVCTAAVAVAMTLNHYLPAVSPLIIAIVAGIALTNVVPLGPAVMPGITFAAKKLLRLGIVFLGLRLVLADIIGLGAPMLLVVVAVVSIGIVSTVLMGRLLKMTPAQSLLIGCGFSICGAAAVAGVEGVTDSKEEDVVTAVALVVIFGTLMIPLVPMLGPMLGLDALTNGLWAGASVHEIAQVVAAGGIIGGGALAAAVVVKLARVLMLAPVATVLSIRMRRHGAADGTKPPIVPLFVVGFLAMVIIRSTVELPAAVLTGAGWAQTALLAAAMFGLGCGVRIRNLVHVGIRPFLLATLATVVVATVSLVGITLIV